MQRLKRRIVSLRNNLLQYRRLGEVQLYHLVCFLKQTIKIMIIQNRVLAVRWKDEQSIITCVFKTNMYQFYRCVKLLLINQV